MGKIVVYEHHGKAVFVDEDLREKHRDHCLCFRCSSLNLDDESKNCVQARMLFSV